MVATKKRQRTKVTTSREQAIAAEIERLRSLHYGEDIGGIVIRQNGLKLTIEQAAELHVDRAGEFNRNTKTICETRTCPATHGNEVQTKGAGTLADQYKGNRRKLNQIVASAKSKGYSPSDSDFYMEPFEAMYGRGDPRCFVKQSDGRHYVRNVIKQHGLSNQGLAGDFDAAPPSEKVVARQKKKGLAPKLLDRYVTEEVKKNPELLRKRKREVQEMVVEKRAFSE